MINYNKTGEDSRIRELAQKGMKDEDIARQLNNEFWGGEDIRTPTGIRRYRERNHIRLNEKEQTFEKAICCGDWHIPFHDERLFELFWEFLAYFNPDFIFLLGDLNDWYDLSKFDKNPKRTGKIKEELALTRLFLKKIHEISPKSTKKMVKGNHEDRLRRYLWRHSEIASLGDEYLNIPQLLKLNEFNIEYSDTGFDYHGIYISHGDRLSKYSAYSAKLSMDDNGCNLIRGHSHRGGTHYKTTWRRSKPQHYVAHESFCMCRLDPEYIDRPNWQQGWICIYVDKESDYFQIEPVCVVDYKFIFEGRMFQN